MLEYSEECVTQLCDAGPLDPAAAATEAARILSAKAEFLKKWAPSYGYGGKIDMLYRDEIGRRMAENEHYLDYTGSSLYCSSTLKTIFDDLQVLALLLCLSVCCSKCPEGSNRSTVPHRFPDGTALLIRLAQLHHHVVRRCNLTFHLGSRILCIFSDDSSNSALPIEQ